MASLAHDNYRNNISRLIRNALDRFVDSTSFEMSEVLKAADFALD